MTIGWPQSVLVLAFTLIYYWRYTRSRPRRPPGPKAYPLLGNVLDFPAMSDMVTRIQLWKKDFGSTVYLSALGMPLVVLNDLKAVIDLFEKRGSIYSHRPRFPMVGELCGFDRLPAIASDSPRLRGLRKLLNSEIGHKKADQYQETMEKEIITYLTKLLQNPTDFVTHIRWFATDIIMLISYGYRVSLTDDVHMTLSNRVMHRLVRDSQPGAWLVDLIPIMRYIPEWFPGAKFKRYAKQVRRELDEWATKPWELVKSRTIVTPSFASRMMEQYPNLTPEVEDLIIWSAASIYSAGADTSISSITTFFLAMILNPEVQTTAQAEIDGIIGSDRRLPGFSDQANLPYVCALVLEVFRWGSILPLGAPRRLTQDDMFDGFEIPRNSTVMANVWGILHDPEVYPDPMDFDPTRFIGENAQPDPRYVVFGFGRRTCPGRYLAEESLFITIAATLSIFNLRAVSSHMPTYEFEDGFITHPKPFKCNVIPRSLAAESLIHALQAEA